jgi:hypothetical protein
MEIRLTPEMERMIQQHLAHGCSRSPESVLKKALHALRRLETMQAQHSDTNAPLPEPSPPALPLIQRLHDTAHPPAGLEEVRRRLAKIPGALVDAIHEERHDRI